jgi:flagellar hook-length control protein FliK
MGGAPAWVSASAAGTAAAAGATDGRIAANPGSPDFAPQLAAHISTFVRDGLQHARLELNPGEMGPLTVQIQLDGNAARVHLAAEHADTRAALEQAMPQLAGSLRENGLTLSGGGVFEQPRQQQAPAGDGRQNGNPGGTEGRANDSRSGSARDAVNGLGSASALAGLGRRQQGVVDLVA